MICFLGVLCSRRMDSKKINTTVGTQFKALFLRSKYRFSPIIHIASFSVFLLISLFYKNFYSAKDISAMISDKGEKGAFSALNFLESKNIPISDHLKLYFTTSCVEKYQILGCILWVCPIPKSQRYKTFSSP